MITQGCMVVPITHAASGRFFLFSTVTLSHVQTTAVRGSRNVSFFLMKDHVMPQLNVNWSGEFRAE